MLISNDTKDNLNAKSVERVIDTGAGYLIRSNSETKEKARPRRFFELRVLLAHSILIQNYPLVSTTKAFIFHTRLIEKKPSFQPKVFEEEHCEECSIPFCASQLRESFDCLICDGCYDRDKYPMMTKSEACKGVDQKLVSAFFLTLCIPAKNISSPISLLLSMSSSSN